LFFCGDIWMTDNRDYQLPVWATRLRKSQIERLYQSCGRGLSDEELIDDVGFSLYSRCLSMLQVTEAMLGHPPCPSCDAVAQLDTEPTTFVRCANCGWICPWPLYQKTYQHKGLFAGGLAPFIEEFVDKFPVTHSYRERMVLIDTLIHRFHWESDEVTDGRPGATSLIQGKMKDIMAFLDRLSYGDVAPPEIERTREEWRKKWRENAWSNGRGQSS
jgi:hypothetical protein